LFGRIHRTSPGGEEEERPRFARRSPRRYPDRRRAKVS